ncbi:MAG TPA: tetratricopeptide repeat protein [Vicinamibacterales bacterium]|nr:tetratricopeptide repeat protein [Vicinamibacterales bacterium]
MRSRLRLLVALVLLGLPIVTATAQGPRRPSQPLQAAARAIMEGRYEQVDGLLAELDAADPDVVAAKARAAMARGRYEQAESMLRAVVPLAPTSEAALELGLLLQMLGRDGALPILERVSLLAGRSPDPLDIARGARALRALGQLRDANAAYQLAANRAPTDPSINTAWGELFLQTEQYGEALKSFQAAIEADEKWTPAIIGGARALAEDNPPEAVALAKRALELNPSSVDAYVFLAGQATDADKRSEGRDLLQKALAINPSSLDAHALLAAMAYVEDKQPEFEAEVAKTLAISPKYGEVYRVAGQLAANNYRFPEAVTLTRRALELDPGHPRALTDLGTHLLRTGDEPAARAALERSFKLHPYSIVTFNLLGMMDKLDTFETVTDGDYVFRMPKAEVAVLREFIVPLTYKAFDEFSRRYQFKPTGPILIELFDKHDDFAVRNVGLPGMVGALGACFGRVVTMDSPKALPPGSFQWEATLWHELAHVFTIQMSNQRVPRWLTEGISAFEEKRARPEWARPNDIEFAILLNRGETIQLRELNAAFTDPRKISLAYYQAALLVEHMVELYGDDGVSRLVKSFAQGVDTDAALKSALDTDFDRLQASFNQFNDRMFAKLRPALEEGPKDEELQGMPLVALRAYASENPQNFQAQMALGRALRKEQQTDEAVQAFERAAALVPVARGANSPHAQLAEMALARKDHPSAIKHLQAVVAVDFDNIDAARRLADLLRSAGTNDPPTLRPVYERIAAIDPFDSEAHAMLGRLAMERNEPEVASREFRAVLALNPVDRAAAITDLAESYLKSGKRAEARKETLAALEIAPSYERAQSLLLDLR